MMVRMKFNADQLQPTAIRGAYGGGTVPGGVNPLRPGHDFRDVASEKDTMAPDLVNAKNCLICPLLSSCLPTLRWFYMIGLGFSSRVSVEQLEWRCRHEKCP